MVEISVIVAVYNCEDYLRECLDYIVNQSFKDIEIICINDGSTDKSLEILDSYQKNDSRIEIVTQKNQGLSAVRNRGISLARGKYIYFCDSDDYLDLNALEELYELSEKLETDFIMFKMNNFDNVTHESIEDDYYTMPYLKERVGENVFNYDDVSDIALKLAVNIPANFYKREFIEHMEFPVGLLFEDNVFFTEALFRAKRVYFYDKKLYNRRIRPNSLSKSLSLDIIEINNILLDLCKQYNHPNHKRRLYYRIFNNSYLIFENAPREYKEEIFKEMRNRFIKYSDRWYEDEFFSNRLNRKYKNIYESAISSDSPHEFELKVKSFNMELEVMKLRKENNKIIKRTEKLKNENDVIKSTKGYKFLKI
ncbi:glycosyltransferase family 2 protein [Methanobrevibacter sp.]